MAKISKSKGILAGALVGAAMGVAAGLLLAPQSGKKTRKDIATITSGFYRYLAPQLKKLKGMSRTEYERYAAKAVHQYSKIKKLSAGESKELMQQAKRAWGHLEKYLR